MNYCYRLGLLLGALACSTLAGAQTDTVFVAEGFNYAPYNGLFQLAGGSAQGWASPWSRAIGDDAILLRGNLDAPGAEAEGTRAHLPFVRAGIRYQREMTPITDEGREIWASVIMNWQPGPAVNNVGNVTLTRGGEQVISFGRKFGNRRIAIVLPGGTNFETEVIAEGTHLLVLKIEMSGNDEPERAYLWVDPPAEQPTGGPEVSTADAATPAAAVRLNGGIDGVQLKVEGTPPLLVDYDNLMIGGSYGSVRPGSPVSINGPEIRTLPVSVVPNPSSGKAALNWEMPVAGSVSVELFDVSGRRIIAYPAQRYPAGPHSLMIDHGQLKLISGTYFIHLKGDRLSGTARIIVR